MTKRFVKFASLFAVVAMLLGLMVTGCSEGNKNPASPIEGKAVLKAIVGFGADVAAKGYDCPSNTEYLSMGVMNEDGLIETEDDYMAALYGAEEKDVTIEGESVHVNAWTENADGSVTMTMKLDYDEVSEAKAEGIAIMAHEKDGTVIGMYTMPATFADGKVTTCDFTDDDAPSFVAVDDLKVELGVDGVDDKTPLSVYLDEETKVDAQLYFYYKDQLVGSYAVSGFKMTTESENLVCSDENGTITGTKVSEGNKVQVAYEYNVGGELLECIINVDVLDVEMECNARYYDVMTRCEDGQELNPGDELYIDFTVNDLPYSFEGYADGGFGAVFTHQPAGTKVHVNEIKIHHFEEWAPGDVHDCGYSNASFSPAEITVSGNNNVFTITGW